MFVILLKLRCSVNCLHIYAYDLHICTFYLHITYELHITAYLSFAYIAYFTKYNCIYSAAFGDSEDHNDLDPEPGAIAPGVCLLIISVVLCDLCGRLQGCHLMTACSSTCPCAMLWCSCSVCAAHWQRCRRRRSVSCLCICTDLRASTVLTAQAKLWCFLPGP